MEKTLNETKEELILKNELIKHNIEEELTILKGDATKIGKMVAIAGGVLLIGYLIFRGKKKSKNKIIKVDGQKYALAAPVKDSFIASTIRKYIIIFLASLAKQKLAQYLQKINTTENFEANSTQTPELQERWS